MTENEFNVLVYIHKNKNLDTERILAENRGLYINELKKILEELSNRAWIADNEVTLAGYTALAPHKVDNAIILAAGRSTRCLPLSNIIPKGLFRVKGEILLEREIEQIKAAGINNIILVLGYMKEKFFYLKDKYNVTIIENPEYDTKGMMHSVYVAKEFMKNTYICFSDNYFRYNVFKEYAYDSYYTCLYSKEYIDEFCITNMKDGYIENFKRGGADAWFSLGSIYFSRNLSSRFVEFLISEYDDPEVHKMLFDEFHIKHIDVLKSQKKEHYQEDIKEFDKLEEIIDFDDTFSDFMKSVSGG